MSNDDPYAGTPEDQFDRGAAAYQEGELPDEDLAEALLGAVGVDESGDFGQVIDIGDRYLGLVTEGVGAKLQVAQETGEYAPVGTDVVARTVNELVAYGLTPVAYENALTVEDMDEEVARRIGTGLANAAERAGILLLRGKHRVVPDVVSGTDLLGTAAGIGDESQLFPGEAATGDRLVGFPSSGIHSDGIEAARAALLDVANEADPDGEEEAPENRTEAVRESLLEPTRLYSYLTDSLQDATVHAAVPITGRGWLGLDRMGDFRYVVSEPIAPQAIFESIRETGDFERETLYRTFNMGTGFVVAAPESAAKAIVSETDGEIIGLVEQGSGVSIRGMEIT